MHAQPAVRRRATVLGLLSILLWSASVALVRSTAEQLGSMRAGMVVHLLAGGGLVLVQLARGDVDMGLRGLPRRYVLGCGTLFVTYLLALFLALGLAPSRVQSLEVGLLNYLWPALTLALSVPLLGYRAGPWLLPGTALALGGVLAVTVSGTGTTLESWLASARHPLAAGLGATAALAWALYSTLARRWAPGADGGAVPWFLLASGLAFMVVSRGAGGEVVLPLRGLLEAAALAAITALGYLGWDHAMRAGDHTLVVAASYLTPLLSTLFASLYLGVAPGPWLWVGCGALVAGSFLSWASVRERPGPA